MASHGRPIWENARADAVEHLGIDRGQLLEVVHELLVVVDGILNLLVGGEVLQGLSWVGAGGGLVGFELFLQRGDAVVLDGEDLLAGAHGAVARQRLLVLAVLEVGVALFERDGVELDDVFQLVDVGLHVGEHLERLFGLLFLGVERDELHRAACGRGGLDAAGGEPFERRRWPWRCCRPPCRRGLRAGAPVRGRRGCFPGGETRGGGRVVLGKIAGLGEGERGLGGAGALGVTDEVILDGLDGLGELLEVEVRRAEREIDRFQLGVEPGFVGRGQAGGNLADEGLDVGDGILVIAVAEGGDGVVEQRCGLDGGRRGDIGRHGAGRAGGERERERERQREAERGGGPGPREDGGAAEEGKPGWGGFAGHRRKVGRRGSGASEKKVNTVRPGGSMPGKRGRGDSPEAGAALIVAGEGV